jgi:hypothetical protein
MRIAWASVALLLFLGFSAGRSFAHGQAASAGAPFGATAQAPLAETPARVAEILRSLEANYLRAEMENDATVASSVLADDFVGIRGDGTTSSREDVLNSLAKRPVSHEPYRIAATNMREHIFGDTACVTYTKVYMVPSSQRTFSENVLHIFTMKNGNWRLQLSSPIPGAGH